MVMGSSMIPIPAVTTFASARTGDQSEPRERGATFTSLNGNLVAASEVAASIIVAADQTLSIGGSAIEVDGETVSAISGGILFIDASHTSTLAFSETTAPPHPEALLTMADGSIVTAFEDPGSNEAVVVNGHTLSLGDVATIDGETPRDGPDGLVVLKSNKISEVIYSTAKDSDAKDISTGSKSSGATMASVSESDAYRTATVSSSGMKIESHPEKLLLLWVSIMMIGIFA